MQDYINKVNELSNLMSDEIILNGDARHAKVLILKFLESAKNSINIISTTLHLYTDNKIIDAFKKALERGVNFKILLDDYTQNNTDRSHKFLAQCNDNCEIKIYKKKAKFHIITMDDTAYRYCGTPGSNTAIASFNGPLTVKNANTKVFNDDTFTTFKNLP